MKKIILSLVGVLCITPLFVYALDIHQAVVSNIRDQMTVEPDKLLAAVERGDYTTVKQMLSFVDINKIFPDYNLLMVVAGGGYYTALDNETRIKMAKIFLDNHIDINAQSGGGHTALMSAIERGTSDMVEFLIANGAKTHVMKKTGETPLFLAARALRKGSLNEEQWKILKAVVAEEYKEVRAIEKNAVPMTPEDGETNLMTHIRQRSDLAFVDLEGGAETHVMDYQGYTPLLLATIPLMQGTWDDFQQQLVKAVVNEEYREIQEIRDLRL